ncbi:hypothetical protein BXO88_09945 [Oribacterium sp. C9]|uniref:hypothetical protein n=1 Tax=Oribacterium sp. C9 TaxID=1943579 RepID=UPI0009901073|nr:hypothetical protein [Oribacterium sp. C9]OON85938.1 hypothetical protein BXO88_09945 [Oribacterium sp. C9]
MITYKCKSCGGQMNFGSSIGLKCPYCGARAFLSDEDYRGNERFRKMVLRFYEAEAEKGDIDYSTDKLFTCNRCDTYIMESGHALNVEYMKKYEKHGFVFYVARESVVYVFENSIEAGTFSDKLKMLEFPAADMKLKRSFPEIRMEIGLKDGKKALVFVRRPNCYPAEMFAPWESVHLAWVISRMENICCALKYSGLRHGDITPDTIWVNPFTHEGILFGDWRGVTRGNDDADLKALRKTAIALASDTRNPEELYRFLNSAPDRDAYSDFEKWDRVIETGFGGHNFRQMMVSG